MITKLTREIALKLTDDEIYISEFVVAKIMGFIPFLEGHPEVTQIFFLNLPNLLNSPIKILFDQTQPTKRFIICGDPTHRVVLEIRRNNRKTEINTIHRIRESTLRKLESKCEIL